MSKDFIPLFQSTPVVQKTSQDVRDDYQNGNQRFRHSSRGERSYKRNYTRGQQSLYISMDTSGDCQGPAVNIDDYLHPGMLANPWKHLQ